MIADQLVTLCVAKGITVTTAESCTGGMISAALTDVAGSSAMFERGFITYSNTAKMDMLGVSAQALDDFGAVSEQVAYEMAQGAQQAANATYAIAVTGIAGPGGSDHKPEGRVCFGLSLADGTTVTETKDFGPLGRKNVRQATVDHALALIFNEISKIA